MKKVLSFILAAVMVFSGIPSMAFAESEATAKQGDATINMLHETKDDNSMCNPLFAEKADIHVEGGNATLKIYAFNPVPGFPDQGADGTVKNVKITYKDKEYKAASDLKTKPVKKAKADNILFGLKGGKEYPVQVLTVTLPEEAVKEGAVLKTDAYVNVVMMNNVVFRMKITDLDLKEVKPETKPEVKPETKPEVKPETKPEVKPETKPETKPEIKPETKPEVKPSEKPDYRNLEDGVYLVKGSMLKATNKNQLSMADKAINHNIKISVKDGKYYVTMDFRGMKIGDKLGYLGKLKYFKTGYETNSYGEPVGRCGNVKVESYQKDKNGNRLKDEFGTDYPDRVTFELIPEALNDGLVPLEVFVPVMDSIAPGLGNQKAYLKLDWNSIEKVSAEDNRFEDNGIIGNGDMTSGSDAGKATPGVNGMAPLTDDSDNPAMLLLLMLLAAVSALSVYRKKEN